jgi:hypothetical protein
MAVNSQNPQLQGPKTKTGKQPESKDTITQDQVRAIADRVYAMLLRDLKEEWERGRMAIYGSGRFKGGR